jgi:hypothetical protein
MIDGNRPDGDWLVDLHRPSDYAQSRRVATPFFCDGCRIADRDNAVCSGGLHRCLQCSVRNVIRTHPVAVPTRGRSSVCVNRSHGTDASFCVPDHAVTLPSQGGIALDSNREFRCESTAKENLPD